MRKLFLISLLGCGNDVTLPASPIDTVIVSPSVMILNSMTKFNNDMKEFYRVGGTVNWIAIIEFDSTTGAPVFQLSINPPEVNHVRNQNIRTEEIGIQIRVGIRNNR